MYTYIHVQGDLLKMRIKLKITVQKSIAIARMI